MLCDQAWGNRRAELLKSQRSFFKPFKKQIKLSTMQVYKNQSAITSNMIAGNTESFRKLHETDMNFQKIRGSNTGNEKGNDVLQF